jgi:hypothetical protein
MLLSLSICADEYYVYFDINDLNGVEIADVKSCKNFTPSVDDHNNYLIIRYELSEKEANEMLKNKKREYEYEM